MKSLTLEQIIAIHSLLIGETGGSDGLRDVGRLESVVATQTQDVFGTELYKTAYEKAAALMRGIIGDHPFVDGNKRTGILAALTFLDINGRTASFKQKEVEDFAVRVAVDHLDIETIATWLKDHSN